MQGYMSTNKFYTKKYPHTVAVESPESSVATLKPLASVVTLVSGTLYKDCWSRKK